MAAHQIQRRSRRCRTGSGLSRHGARFCHKVQARHHRSGRRERPRRHRKYCSYHKQVCLKYANLLSNSQVHLFPSEEVKYNKDDSCEEAEFQSWK